MSVVDEDLEAPTAPIRTDTSEEEPPQAPTGAGVDDDLDETEAEVRAPVPVRPLLVAALATSAAALTTGGIFGSWPARLLSFGAALVGVAWCFLTLRSIRRRVMYQALLLPVTVGLAALALLPGSGGNASFGGLIADAIKAGRLFRPPVPFDPGWRPILVIVFVSVGYAAAWVGTALERPLAGLVLPGVVIALTAITQPPGGQVLTGILAGAPLVAALAVMFGGDVRSASQLGSSFEIRRLIRAIPAFAGAVVVLVLLNNSNFLFPKPVYNPQQKPQKPKSIPLSEAQDKVLFTVDGPVTGPWALGTLDVYQDGSFLLPPFDPTKTKKTPATGTVIDKSRTPTVTVKFTTGDLGNTSVLPGLVDPVNIALTSAPPITYDPTSETFRMATGRVPTGLTYSESIPAYPAAATLAQAGPLTNRSAFRTDLYAPPAPPAVRQLLSQAPDNPWGRLDYLRNALLKVVVANGAGVPEPVTPAKVTQMLTGNHQGSPYDIVAAEVLMARWAGLPARIGFGFDGKNLEGKVYTVRPKNSAQWLEVYFQGYGWVPIVGTPPRAQANLNNKNTQVNPTVQASNDIAVELYIPVNLPSLKQLYQEVRDVILTLLPFAALILLLYMALPVAKKWWRSAKRRKWAAALGPRAQISVEYAEFRDWATDLGVGDPLDTPLEFLKKVVPDDQHLELAWLVSRTLYGDMALTATEADAEAAHELVSSLRRRLFGPQPTQTKVLAVLTRASLAEPYTNEVPNVRLWRLPRPKLTGRRRNRRRGGRRPGAGPRLNRLRYIRLRRSAPVAAGRSQ
ncbi:MAG TPA: transglutaminase domain-containing protein [Acidimicrobiales bacterium]|nr:transglutaminase domain-containing protein [Acidimicrobiales bacterium]